MAVKNYTAVFSERSQYTYVIVIDDGNQSIPNNQTTLDIKIYAQKTSAHSGSWTGSGVSAWFNLNGARLWTNSNFGYDFRNIPLWGSILIAHFTHTITHDSAGNASYTIHSTMSGGPLGSATVGPVPAPPPKRIPQKPSAPVLSVLTALSPTSMRMNWSLPNAQGGTIDGYRVQYADNSGFSGATTVNTGNTTRSRDITSLSPGKTWYARVAAQNEAGVGSYSAAQSLRLGIGGKRRGGTSFDPFSIARRFDGTSWVDLSIGRRYNGSSWVDLSG